MLTHNTNSNIGTNIGVRSHPKTNFLKKVFSEVPETYERINHTLTLGLDILWRRQTAKIAAASGGTHWADMCTGTGEMACYLSRLAKSGTVIYAVDFSIPMMTEAMKKPEARNIEFVVSDVKALPFPDESLDLITISFATRNINLSSDILVQTFTEFYRVLKPGGRFVNLETSQPSSLLFKWFFHFYIRLFVKFVGKLISGSHSGYAYLAHTIPRFYPPKALKDIMCRSGFKKVFHRELLFGVASIHQGIKS
jgi:demethylmenaquinone methyltransferase/2-methoxy-6-polyprenyl-1,4-benzoquinol methylase